MTIEMIQAGHWIFSESGTSEYSIYKLLRGKVSIHKSGRKIREVEVTKGMKPIILGITAMLRDDRQHGSSVKAESDIEVDRIFVDRLKDIIANEIPPGIKNEVTTMIKSINMGNEITSLKIKYSELSHVEITIPDNVTPDTKEVLTEITRLYSLVKNEMDK